MAFTQVTVTGTVTLSNATPASGASVNFTLNTPITDGTQIVTPEELTVRCASDGTFTITLNANDDTTTLPLGTYYAVSIVYGTQTLGSFNVIVPHASSPVNLFTLATLPNPNVVNPYVSQLVAGTGVSLSPLGGTGQVTVSSSGAATGGLLYTRPGGLAVETGALRLPITTPLAITSVTAMVNTEPTGASIVVDVLKNFTTLSSTLSTGAPITSLPVAATPVALASGATVTVTDGQGHTQAWTLSASASLGATSLTVTSQTPNFAYPSGSRLITSVFVTQANRPTIAVNTDASPAATPDITALSAGDFLLLSIAQVGSTVAGSDLTVALLVH